MGILQRQNIGMATKVFSARLPEDRYKSLVDFALDKRYTMAAAVTHLLSKALIAESGEPYKPDSPDGESNIQ